MNENTDRLVGSLIMVPVRTMMVTAFGCVLLVAWPFGSLYFLVAMKGVSLKERLVTALLWPLAVWGMLGMMELGAENPLGAMARWIRRGER